MSCLNGQAKLKIYAANKGRTVTDIIIELVNTELKTKKSNHFKFSDTSDYSKENHKRNSFFIIRDFILKIKEKLNL